MNAMLPFWILGAPLVIAIVIRFMTPSANSGRSTAAAAGARPGPAPSARR